MAIVKSALPKTRSGRKATPLDDSLVKELTEALKAEPIDTDGNGDKRPAAYGPATDYDTEGKASAAGRRYANVVEEKVGKKVSVNTFSASGENGNPPFRWRIYIPLVHSQEKKGNSKK